MTAIDTLDGTHNQPPPKAGNIKIIMRLMSYMTPFNWIMFISLTARVTKIVFQAAVLGIAAASAAGEGHNAANWFRHALLSRG